MPTVEVTSSSASKSDMQYAYGSRRRCRGTYYKGFVLAFVSSLAKKVGVSFSAVVNLLLEKLIEGDLAGAVEESVALKVKRLRLLEEEVELRRTLKVILRSGARARRRILVI